MIKLFRRCHTHPSEHGECYADHAVWEMGLLRDKHVMPWRIEDELKKLAIRDSNLITRQRNFSGADPARAVVEALGA